MTTKILVAGGATGIGAAIAKRLSSIEVLDTDVYVPEQVWIANWLHFQLDIRKDESIEDYLKEYGPFDAIVYTVGINQLNYIEDASRDELAAIMDTNAFGFARLLGIHASLFGHDALDSAVAITSDAAHNPMRGSTAYTASKAALEMIIRNIAREWTPHTRVNGVAPSVVEGTPMSKVIDSVVPGFRGWTPEQAEDYEKSQQPMGRRVTPDEIAEVVEFVLFGPAYLTGSIIPISAGK